MWPGGEAGGRPDPGETRTGQVHELEGPEGLDERERALLELVLRDGVDARGAAERLDERPVEGFGRVEDAVATERIVEAVAAGVAEVERIVPGSVDAEPVRSDLDYGEGTGREVSGRERALVDRGATLRRALLAVGPGGAQHRGQLAAAERREWRLSVETAIGGDDEGR